jgi:protein-S-isoprenylcysteine O-methyltransferase Ste14
MQIIAAIFAIGVFLSCPIGAAMQEPLIVSIYLFLAMPAGAALLWALRYAGKQKRV